MPELLLGGLLGDVGALGAADALGAGLADAAGAAVGGAADIGALGAGASAIGAGADLGLADAAAAATGASAIGDLGGLGAISDAVGADALGGVAGITDIGAGTGLAGLSDVPLGIAGGVEGPAVGLGTDLAGTFPAASLGDVAGGFPGAALGAAPISDFGLTDITGLGPAGGVGGFGGSAALGGIPGITDLSAIEAGANPFAGSVVGQDFTSPFGVTPAPSGLTPNELVGSNFPQPGEFGPSNFETQVQLQQAGINTDPNFANLPSTTNADSLQPGPPGTPGVQGVQPSQIASLQGQPVNTTVGGVSPVSNVPSTGPFTQGLGGATQGAGPLGGLPATGDVLPGVPTDIAPPGPGSQLLAGSEVPAPDLSAGVTPANAASAGGAPPFTTFNPPSAAGSLGSFFGGMSNFQLASLAVGVGGLGMAVARNLMALPQEAELKTIAARIASNSAQEAADAQKLLDPLLTGNLPPNLAQQVVQAQQDAITAIKAKYSSMNQSGSSAEVDEIARAIQNTAVVSGQLEQQLAQSGIELSQQATTGLNVEAQIFQALMSSQIQSDTALAQAIAAFAGQAALAGAIQNRSPTSAAGLPATGGVNI